MTAELESVGVRQPEKMPVAAPVSVRTRVWAPEPIALVAVIEVCAAAMGSAFVVKFKLESSTVTQTEGPESKPNEVADTWLPLELAMLAEEA